MKDFTKILIIGVLFGALLIGCAQPEEEPGATEMPPEPEPEEEPEPEVQTVEVTETEWGIELSPSTVDAGMVRFVIMNEGGLYHELEIEGNGQEWVVKDGIPSNESATLEAELTAGTYSVFCPIPGHVERGMTAQLTVQ